MKRVLTAAILVPPVIYLVHWAPVPLLTAAVALLALLCFREYLDLVRAYGVDASGPFGYAAGLVVLLVPRVDIAIVTAIALLAMVLALRSKDIKGVWLEAALIMLGILYAFGTWRAALSLKAVSAHWLFFALMINWLGDAAAFFTGKAFGRHRLAPELSPKKTWEGTLGSVAVSIISGVLYIHWFGPAVPLWEVAILAAVANAAGQLGDLWESALKRAAGVKDSGAMLPGHGGWLDRLDSSLFAMPVVYLWVGRPWGG